MSGLRYYIGAGCDQTRLGGVKNSLTESYPSKGLLILKEPFPMLLKGPWLGTPSFRSVGIKVRSLGGGPNPVATRRIIILVGIFYLPLTSTVIGWRAMSKLSRCFFADTLLI